MREPTGAPEPTASVEPVALDRLGLELEFLWDGLNLRLRSVRSGLPGGTKALMPALTHVPRHLGTQVGNTERLGHVA